MFIVEQQQIKQIAQALSETLGHIGQSSGRGKPTKVEKKKDAEGRMIGVVMTFADGSQEEIPVA